MAKFNVVQKQRREQIQERKRALHGHPRTGKLKQRAPPASISGKRKRKLLRRSQKEQKAAIRKGLLAMEDVEMAVAEGSSAGTNEKPQMKFNLKKNTRLQIKRLKGKSKGKSKRKSANPTTQQIDAMAE